MSNLYTVIWIGQNTEFTQPDLSYDKVHTVVYNYTADQIDAAIESGQSLPLPDGALTTSICIYQQTDQIVFD